MRIISPFHDFYDVIQKTGQDRSVLYLRRPVEIVLRAADLPRFPCFGYYANSYYKFGIAKYFLGFCGVVYPALRLSAPLGAPGEADRVVFDVDQAVEWITTNLPESVSKHLYDKKRHFGRRYNGCPRRQEIVEAFSKAHETPPVDLFERFDAPIFIARECPRSVDWDVVINGCLKDLGFYRVKPPQQAFQDLAMWVGGRAQPSMPMPIVSDVVLAEAKGFDKYSFRKEPTVSSRGATR